MIPESSTVLLVAGVCAVVTGFDTGGTAVPVDASALAALLPAPLAAPAPPGNCTVSLRKATPSQNTKQTITVHTTRGADAYLVVHYPTTTRSFTIVADSAGTAVITFPISLSVPGSPVRVDVSTDSGQVCGIQFTPQ